LIIVVDAAWGVEGGRGVEWRWEDGIVHRARSLVRSQMVDDDVYHEGHAAAVQSVGKALQIGWSPEVGVEREWVVAPVWYASQKRFIEWL
jgi:hypothetical protein